MQEPDDNDWFARWHGLHVDIVFQEFEMESMYDEIRQLSDDTIITMEYHPSRATIWFDKNTNLVSDISIG